MCIKGNVGLPIRETRMVVLMHSLRFPTFRLPSSDTAGGRLQSQTRLRDFYLLARHSSVSPVL